MQLCLQLAVTSCIHAWIFANDHYMRTAHINWAFIKMLVFGQAAVLLSMSSTIYDNSDRQTSKQTLTLLAISNWEHHLASWELPCAVIHIPAQTSRNYTGSDQPPYRERAPAGSHTRLDRWRGGGGGVSHEDAPQSCQ